MKTKLITSIIVAFLFATMIISVPNAEAVSVQVLYDDFEDGILDDWNFTAGASAVSNIAYAGNKSASLPDTVDTYQNFTTQDEVLINTWIYLNTSAGTQLLKIRRINISDPTQYVTQTLEWNDTTNFNNSLALVTTYSGGGAQYHTMDIHPPLQTWFNIGLWSDGDRVRVFYNGSLLLDIANSTTFGFNQLRIGTSSLRFSGPSEYLSDDLYIWTGSDANYRAGGMQSGLDVVWFSASHGGHPYANGTAEIIGGAKSEAGAGANYSAPNRLARNRTVADMYWGAQTTTTAKARFQTDVLDLNPNMTVLLLGPNDYPSFPSSTTITNIQNMTDWALANNIIVILVEPPPLKDGGNSSHKLKINDTVDFVRQYANDTGNVFLCSIFEFFRDDNYTLNATYRAPDGNHFNLLGLSKLAQFVEQAIGNATPFVPPPPPPPPPTLGDLINDEVAASIPIIVNLIFVAITLFVVSFIIVSLFALRGRKR